MRSSYWKSLVAIGSFLELARFKKTLGLNHENSLHIKLTHFRRRNKTN